ncbi:hypothetical protein GW17_00040580 [Ensete ventricosum]|nr:hypothetical protein GW17_00040580 [Ensete ventricosum]RZS21461.1 hypothetical protein BHM03_00054098 [Ensete ventricosum]
MLLSPLPLHRRRLPPCQGVATPAVNTSTGVVPIGGHPCRRQPLRVLPLPTGCLPTGAEPAVGHPLRAGRGRPSTDRWQQPLRHGHGRLPPLAGATLQPATLKRLPVRSGHGRAPPSCELALAATDRPFARGLGHSRSPLASSQAMAGRPCRGPGRDQPPLHTDSMLVVAPPPQAAPTFVASCCNKCVEQFYVIQSDHTQFKINLSHENLGSDTTVGKPQREHHMRSGNQNKIPIFNADQIVVQNIGVMKKM